MYILIIFFFLKSLRPDAGTEIEALSPAGDTVVEVRVHDSWLMAFTSFVLMIRTLSLFYTCHLVVLCHVGLHMKMYMYMNFSVVLFSNSLFMLEIYVYK